MADFNTNTIYTFTDSKNLIEKYTRNSKEDIEDKSKIYLGYFLEYIEGVYGFDWSCDIKARFEFGIISKRYYDKVIPSSSV